jgi:hypothetical protein
MRRKKLAVVGMVGIASGIMMMGCMPSEAKQAKHSEIVVLETSEKGEGKGLENVSSQNKEGDSANEDRLASVSIESVKKVKNASFQGWIDDDHVIIFRKNKIASSTPPKTINTMGIYDIKRGEYNQLSLDFEDVEEVIYNSKNGLVAYSLKDDYNEAYKIKVVDTDRKKIMDLTNLTEYDVERFGFFDEGLKVPYKKHGIAFYSVDQEPIILKHLVKGSIENIVVDDDKFYFIEKNEGMNLYSVDLSGRNLKKIDEDVIAIKKDGDRISYLKNAKKAHGKYELSSKSQEYVRTKSGVFENTGDYNDILERGYRGFVSFSGAEAVKLQFAYLEDDTIEPIDLDSHIVLDFNITNYFEKDEHWLGYKESPMDDFVRFYGYDYALSSKCMTKADGSLRYVITYDGYTISKANGYTDGIYRGDNIAIIDMNK